MKTKLLKKVRKRYSITKVTKLASDACSTYKECAVELGLPFYIVQDVNDSFGLYTRFYNSFDAARDRVMRCIISDYGEKFRHVDGESEKVWWGNN